MRWNHGFTSAFYGYVVDPITWRELERFEIVGGEINRSGDGLQESADIQTAKRRQESEQYIRIYLDAEQGGTREHVPLFTGLACSPGRETEDGFESNTLECYSVLKAADDMQLPRGYFVGRGTSAGVAVKELLSVLPAPISIEGITPSLSSHLLAEDEETRLSMAQKVLGAINWKLRINGRGEILISAHSDAPKVVLDPRGNDVIQQNIEIEHDWYAAPNVFRAISDSETAVARDESESSPLSIINRGREVWISDTSPDLNSSESLAEYALRRLKELQNVSMKVSYDRRFIPDINVNDVITLHYPEIGLDGDYRIHSQKIELEYGATVSEEAELV